MLIFYLLELPSYIYCSLKDSTYSKVQWGYESHVPVENIRRAPATSSRKGSGPFSYSQHAHFKEETGWMPGGWTEYGNPSLPVSRAGRTTREWGKGRHSPSNSVLTRTYTCAGLTVTMPIWVLLRAKQTRPTLQLACVQLSTVVFSFVTCLRLSVMAEVRTVLVRYTHRQCTDTARFWHP